MDAWIDFFGSLEHRPVIRVLIVALPMALLWFLEDGFPLVRMAYRSTKARHGVINIILSLIHLGIHAALAVLLVMVCRWCQENAFGLVHWLSLGAAGIVVTGILGMDFFGGWLVHIIEHKWALLWRIHIVHHADNNVDVTTGLRHHPFEAINRWIFFTLGVWLLGLPVYAVLIGQTFMSIFTLITHANIRLPERLDRVLSWVLVSPNMHKVHHHWQQPYTDSNYGTALSIWDRLLGTFSYLEPGQLRYGLDRYYNNDLDEDMSALMKSPFDRWDEVKVAPPVAHGPEQSEQ